MFRGLKGNRSLKTLDISWNGLGTQRGTHEGPLEELNLALALCKLQCIDLGNNRIGDVGATILAAGLGRAKTLEKIRMDGNKMGRKGARALLKGGLPSLITLT